MQDACKHARQFALCDVYTQQTDVYTQRTDLHTCKTLVNMRGSLLCVYATPPLVCVHTLCIHKKALYVRNCTSVYVFEQCGRVLAMCTDHTLRYVVVSCSRPGQAVKRLTPPPPACPIARSARLGAGA